MRYTPMSVGEQCILERDMLVHFKLAEINESASLDQHGNITTSRMFQIRDDSGARKAVTISQMFFSLAETPDAPIDCEEMILAIRYKLGYGWWAWFFFKNFAIPIIKWLWAKYHNPDPVGSPTT